jgi:hypothetical protein
VRAALLLLLLPSLALAEEPAGGVDYAVPDNPAFGFLGVSPTKIGQPGSARELAAELSNLLDGSGQVQRGFALEIRPVPLLVKGPRAVALDSWKSPKATLLYILASTQLSLATAEAPGESEDVDLAAGLRINVYDGGDPMRDEAYRAGLAADLLACLPEADPMQEPEPSLECLEKKVQKRREAYLDEHWNDFRVSVAGVSAWRFPGGSSTSDDTSHVGWGAWLLVSGGTGPLLATGQLRFDDRDGDGSRFSAGARAHFGNPRFHAVAEIIGETVSDAPAGDDQDLDWGFGAELRVTGNTWLVLGLGNALDDDSEVQMLGSLRWGLTDEARFER